MACRKDLCDRTITNLRLSSKERGQKYALLRSLTRFDNVLSAKLDRLVSLETATVAYCDKLLDSSVVTANDMFLVGEMLARAYKVEKEIESLLENAIAR